MGGVPSLPACPDRGLPGTGRGAIRLPERRHSAFSARRFNVIVANGEWCRALG